MTEVRVRPRGRTDTSDDAAKKTHCVSPNAYRCPSVRT
jgi:hypothetical protein